MGRMKAGGIARLIHEVCRYSEGLVVMATACSIDRMRSEARELELVADPDAMPFAKPRVHLHHVLGFTVNREWGIGVWFGVRNYANHAAIAAGKDHVQGHLRIVHPEGSMLGRGKDEQHPGIRRQLVAVHETALALRSGLSELDLDRCPLLVTRSDNHYLRTLAMCTLHQRQHRHR